MKSHKFILILSALVLAIAACNLPESSTPPSQDVAQIVAQTQTAIAIQDYLTATVAPQQEIPANTPTSQLEAQETAAQSATATSTQTAVPETPTPTATVQANCQDKAQFISETVPDETVFSPGTPFVKTWVLKNSGTCTWTPDYQLIFSSGEAMSSPGSVPFGAATSPGNTIELKLSLTAPSAAGEYTGYWKLRNPNNQEFGKLWVKIIVSGGSTNISSTLGAPTWTESFSSSASFALGAGSGIDFSLTDGSLVMTAFSPQGDQWRISSRGYLDDFYLEARFKTGSACSGRDSYGLIVRAPDQPDNIIDSAYVFNFSCEGKFRVYRLDNGVFTSIQNWTASPYILPGPSKANNMGIRTKGNLIQVFANGSLVFEFNDNTYTNGYFGLAIRSDQTNNFQVLVSEILYWDLSP